MRLAWPVLGILLASCAPSISSFRAEPNGTCAGAPATLSWAASTDGNLSSSTNDIAKEKVAASGQRSVSPSATSRYHLEVRRFCRTRFKDVDVQVVAPGAPTELAGTVADPSTKCEGRTLSTTITAPPAAWAPQLHAGRVKLAAGVRRAYHVEHLGRAADVVPGDGTADFAALPVQGEWKLTTPLGPTEECGRKVPRSLVILVEPTCAP
jgi:hypothetical protein